VTSIFQDYYRENVVEDNRYLREEK